MNAAEQQKLVNNVIDLVCNTCETYDDVFAVLEITTFSFIRTIANKAYKAEVYRKISNDFLERLKLDENEHKD
jgi:hypothetical protein